MSMLSSQIRMLTALGTAIADQVAADDVAKVGDTRTPAEEATRMFGELLAQACLNAGNALLNQEKALLEAITHR